MKRYTSVIKKMLLHGSHYMKCISPSIVNTWLFLAQSTDPKLAHAKFLAYQQIKKYYGSCDSAKAYVEQVNDKDIEIIVV